MDCPRSMRRRHPPLLAQPKRHRPHRAREPGRPPLSFPLLLLDLFRRHPRHCRRWLGAHPPQQEEPLVRVHSANDRLEHGLLHVFYRFPRLQLRRVFEPMVPLDGAPTRLPCPVVEGVPKSIQLGVCYGYGLSYFRSERGELVCLSSKRDVVA